MAPKTNLARLLTHITQFHKSRLQRRLINTFAGMTAAFLESGIDAADGDAVADWAAGQKPAYVAQVSVQYSAMATELSAPLSKGLGIFTGGRDPAMLQVIQDGGRRAGLIDITDRPALFRAIADARAEGLNPRAFQTKIAKLVPAGRFRNPRTRALLIARTETIHAQRQSALNTYTAKGVTRVQVIDGRHRGSDEDCGARNGQIVSLEEAQRLAAGEHPNGTMGFAPVVDLPGPGLLAPEREAVREAAKTLPPRLRSQIERLR